MDTITLNGYVKNEESKIEPHVFSLNLGGGGFRKGGHRLIKGDSILDDYYLFTFKSKNEFMEMVSEKMYIKEEDYERFQLFFNRR